MVLCQFVFYFLYVPCFTFNIKEFLEVIFFHQLHVLASSSCKEKPYIKLNISLETLMIFVRVHVRMIVHLNMI